MPGCPAAARPAPGPGPAVPGKGSEGGQSTGSGQRHVRRRTRGVRWPMKAWIKTAQSDTLLFQATNQQSACTLQTLSDYPLPPAHAGRTWMRFQPACASAPTSSTCRSPWAPPPGRPPPLLLWRWLRLASASSSSSSWRACCSCVCARNVQKACVTPCSTQGGRSCHGMPFEH